MPGDAPLAGRGLLEGRRLPFSDVLAAPLRRRATDNECPRCSRSSDRGVNGGVDGIAPRLRAGQRGRGRLKHGPVSEPSRGPSEGQNKEREQGVLLTVSYDGTAFRGWARQNGVRTVEETLMGAVL